MSLYDHPINTLDGSPLELQDLADKTVLIVNVASRCGLTPQYEGLEHLQERYADKGFTVLPATSSASRSRARPRRSRRSARRPTASRSL